MNSDLTCQFCKHVFSNRGNLKTHQKKTKYCLKLQNKKVVERFKCLTCNKEFSLKTSYDRHFSSHLNDPVYKRVQDLEAENIRLKQALEYSTERILTIEKEKRMLQDQMSEVALKAVSANRTTNKTTTNNMIINNFAPLTTERIEEHVPNLTIEHIERGPRGYAEFATDGPFKDAVACVDYARRILTYKNENGVICTDPNGVKILRKFCNAIDDRNRKLIHEMSDRFRQDTTLDPEELMDQMVAMSGYQLGVGKVKDGEKSDFGIDLLKEICSIIK